MTPAQHQPPRSRACSELGRPTIPAVLAILLAVAPVRGEFALGDEDRVLFFGDSFIESKAVPIYVESYVRVKYPQLRCRFINPATRHFTAREGLQRLDELMEPTSPTVVVVVFGFHDPGRKAFDERRLAEFREDYTVIVKKITDRGARALLVTPPCPASAPLPRAPDVKYREVVGRYAAAIRDIGRSHSADVVDWFSGSAILVEGDEATTTQPRRRRSSIMPPALAQVVLAAQLLKHWQAEPIAVDIGLDWRTGQAGVSHGKVQVQRAPDGVTLQLSELPLPWAITGVSTRDLYQTSWPGSDLCRYTLTVQNPPPQGIEVLLGGAPMQHEAADLSAGIDISGWPPLQSRNPALGLLYKYIKEKYRYQGKYWGEVRPRRPQEPELQVAFEMYSKALREFETGYHRIIQRVPKRFDVSLKLQARQTPTPVPPTGEDVP